MNASPPSSDRSLDAGEVEPQFQPPSSDVSAHPGVSRRSRWPVVGIGLLAAVLGGAVVLAAMAIGSAVSPRPAADETPKYAASALLRVSAQERPLVFQTMDRDLPGDFDVYKRTQQQLLKSRFVLAAALRQPKIAQLRIIRSQADPIAWLGSKLQVDFPGDAEILEVSLAGDDPESLAALVNAVVEAYLKQVADGQRRRRTGRLNELDRVFAEKERGIRSKRDALKQLAEQLGSSDTDALGLKQQVALQEYAESRRELVSLRIEWRQAETELKIQQALLADVDRLGVSEIDLDSFMQSDPVANQLLSQMSQLGQQLGDIEATTTAPARAQYVEKFQRDLKALQEQLDVRRAALREELKLRTRGTIEADIKRLQVRIAVLSEQQRELQTSLEQQLLGIERFGRSSVEIEMMRAEIEQLAKVLAAVAEEREMLKVELQSVSRISLLQPAEAPPQVTW